MLLFILFFYLFFLDKKKFCFSCGAWVAQLVKGPVLGFGSDCDLTVVGSSPALGSMLRVESA